VYDRFMQTQLSGGAPTDSPEAVALLSTAKRFIRAFTDLAGDRDSAVYLVGSPALGDVSPRQSNVDLVAVSAEPLDSERLLQLSSVHKTLRVNARDAAVCYTTWAGLRTPPAEAEAVVYVGHRRVERDWLANPMTWAIMANRPSPLHGEDPGTVHSGPDKVRAWCATRLPGLAQRTGRLLWRRHLARVVLQSTRCAYGALTGDVVSLRRAGELALQTASHTGHRVITDALGYREGANTSMYWGPFERKSNAVILVDDCLRQVEAARN
jgi:hypothetical protein